MWWLRAPTAIRRPISRVRSVTETSMMFMMPTPPTTSEMAATTSSKAPINSEAEDIVLVISVMSRMLKSSSAIGRKVMPLAQQAGDLVDGLRDLLGGGGLGEDLVHVGEAHRLRRVGDLGRRTAPDRAAVAAGIEIAQRVDVRQRRCDAVD